MGEYVLRGTDRPRSPRAALFVAVLVTLYLVCALADCGDVDYRLTAVAQDVDEATVLVVAQSMVAEGDWRAVDDHAAVAFTLQRLARQRHVSLREHALDYVAAFDSRNKKPRPIWIRNLNLAAVEPEGWPARASWEAHVDLWLAVIERARAFLRGELRNPCPGATDFGGDMDDPPSGLVRVSCIRATTSTYYRRAKR